MKTKRRDFLKLSGLAGLTLASDGVLGGLRSDSVGSIAQIIPANSKPEYIRRDHLLNDQIKADFELARNILKPTQKQLEHGLELHRNSLVIESYGFMPRASLDGAKMASAINSGASALEIQEMNEEMIMTRFTNNSKERAEFENAWKAAGVTCI